MPEAIYPWQQELLSRIWHQKEQDKLPHALLFSGPRNLGKRDFARAIVGLMHCTNPDSEGRCLECENCRLISAGTHPDFKQISPFESKLIRIEQIRELIDWINQTPQRAGPRTVIIDPAEQMNASSSNALLKSLEEPGKNTMLILISDMKGRLSPTIRSRCQLVDFHVPAHEEAIAFLGSHRETPGGADLEILLKVAGGAPLAVINEFDDTYLTRRHEVITALKAVVEGGNPLAAVAGIAKGFAKRDPGKDMDIVYSLFSDALRYKMSGSQKLIKNKDVESLVTLISELGDQTGLMAMVDLISTERRAATGPSNPNMPLLFESLFIELQKHCSL